MRPELVLLLPLLALGALAMAAGLFFVLWRNLQRPVAAMVAAVDEERPVPPTGIEEFDSIGRAVNEALDAGRGAHRRTHGELGERRKVEAALHERESAHPAPAQLDGGGDLRGRRSRRVCTFCNPACLRMLGYADGGELLGEQSTR